MVSREPMEPGSLWPDGEPLPYEAPRLEPLPFLHVHKVGVQDVSVGVRQDDATDVAKLLQKYGSPLYIVNENQLCSDFQVFRDAFTHPGIETRVAYSVKTNYLPAICATIFREGGWAEVVSGMEYELVKSLGVAGPKIVFNGPHKTVAELRQAFADGATVNIDNFDELAMVEQLAAGFAEPLKIGIRVSFRYGMWPWVKFGFSDDNGDCQRVLERIAQHPQLDLVLLHNHGGTFLLVHDVYANAADRLIDVAKRARDLGLKPTTIDLGGGFPSVNTLKPMLDIPGGSSREAGYLSKYADVICSRLYAARELFGGHPTLILEPGRAVVDACTQLACSVIAKKEIAGQGSAIIVDAGTNLIPTSCYYDHGVKSQDGNDDDGMNGALQPVSIFGPLCMQSDMLRERALLPAVQIGDPIVISNVGAYCHTQSSQFIQPRPATIMLGPEGPELIRRRETWRDVFVLDRVPARLGGSPIVD